MPADEEYKEAITAAVQQQMELYVIPEVRRRQAANQLPKPFDLHRFQILYSPKGGIAGIRLNYEVRGRLKVDVKDRPGSAVITDLGPPTSADALPPDQDAAQLSEPEVAAVLDFELPPEEADLGHFSCIRYGGRGFVRFDFQYNRATAAMHADAAAQFLGAADWCRRSHAWSALVDNLFSAAELLAKAELLLLLEMRANTHGHIKNLYNLHFRDGKILDPHKSTLNSLSHLRTPARYLTKGSFGISEAEASAWYERVSAMLEHVRNSCRLNLH